MKILKCHIENFGKLQNFDYSFNSSFNEIIEDNSWGKTTFSVFIKSMFYGLASTKKNIKENERTKYKPWQGGNFGGNLEFEINEEVYKIERFFGNKESEDTFLLIDIKTGKESKKYSKNIGLELFELDADAYERSTYIPQKEITNGINDKITTKLINMIQGTNNPESFENAKKFIKERISKLKRKGNAGLISECESNISALYEEIDSLKKCSENIDLIQNKILIKNESIENLENQKEILSHKIKDYSKNQQIIANKKYISDNEQKILELKTRIDKNMNILNGNKIDYENLKNIQSRENLKKANIKQLESIKSNMEEIPDKLIETFKNKETSNNEIEKYIDKVKDSNELTNNLKVLNQPQEDNSLQKKKISNTPVYVILSLSLIMLILGAVFISSNLPLSIVFFVLGIICICTSGFLYFKNYIEIKTTLPIKTNQNNIIDDEIKLKTDKLKSINEEIDIFIKRFTNEEVFDKINFLYNLKSKHEKYNDLLEKQEINNKKIEKLLQEINEDDIFIMNYLNKFNFENELSNEDKFEQLKEIFIKLENDEDELNKVINNLDNFKTTYSINDSIDTNIENIDIDDMQKQEKLLQKEIDKYREEKTSLIKNIDNIRNDLSILNELEENLETLKNQEVSLKKEYELLNLTSEFLEKANNNLSSKYLNPMQNNLNKYMELLLKDKYQELNLDTDLNVSLEVYGKLRELDYLSKGMQEVVDICIRFSLIDVLFSKEKPFIILDDPFVNMDKSKLERAVKLIKDISETYQIIYLICHESRK